MVDWIALAAPGLLMGPVVVVVVVVYCCF